MVSLWLSALNDPAVILINRFLNRNSFKKGKFERYFAVLIVNQWLLREKRKKDASLNSLALDELKLFQLVLLPFTIKFKRRSITSRINLNFLMILFRSRWIIRFDIMLTMLKLA
jgi:hypothetical protein